MATHSSISLENPHGQRSLVGFISWGRKELDTTGRLRTWDLGGFPSGSDGKKSAYNVGDQGLIPGYGRSPGEGHGNPLQCSCLENRMDRGAWRAAVHGATGSRTGLSE